MDDPEEECKVPSSDSFEVENSCDPSSGCNSFIDRFENILQQYVRVDNSQGKRYQCIICCNYFSTTNNLRYHLFELHGEDKLHKCEVCGEVFKQRYDWIVHKKNHIKPKPYKCDKCDKKFMKKHSLKSHEMLHLDIKFPCRVCSKIFETNTRLKVHEKIHLLHKKYECQLCGRRFTGMSGLKYHMYSHTNMHKMNCSICDRKFMNFKQCINHEKIHTGNLSTFSCHLCNKIFFKQTSFENHMNIHNKKHCCEICQQNFQTKYGLASHLKIHSGEKVYSCNDCEKAFYSKSALNNHVKIEHDITKAKYSCKYCKKGFISKSIFDDHMRMHQGIVKFHKCDLCSASFSHKSSLLNHKRKHYGRKYTKRRIGQQYKYECEFCGKKFNTPSDRKSHLFKHTGYKPFRCHICGKAFRTQSSCNIHVNIHTLPYECGICHKRYSCKSLLVRHLKRHQQQMKNSQLVDINREEENIKLENNSSEGYDTNKQKVHCVSGIIVPTSKIKCEACGSQNNISSSCQISSTTYSSVNSNQQTAPVTLSSFSGISIDSNIKDEAIVPLSSDKSGRNLVQNGFKTEITTASNSNAILPVEGNSLTVKKVGSFTVNAEDLRKILTGKLVFSEVKPFVTEENTTNQK